jgi:hypothetical protein
MADYRHHIASVSLSLLLIVVTIGALPVVALEADSSYARPTTPGATADYRVALVAQEGDSITETGLRSVTLDFTADPDFSGSTANVTARNTSIRIGQSDTNGTTPAGPVSVSKPPANDRVTVNLLSPYRDLQPGDRIIVEVGNVTNSAIAAQGVQGLRGFALNVSATSSQNVTVGPVQTRYTLNASAQPSPAGTTTPTTAPETTGTSSSATVITLRPSPTGTNTTAAQPPNTTTNPAMSAIAGIKASAG